MIKKLKLAIGNLGVKWIKFVARKAKIDLIRLAYSENGISKSHSLEASGELFFIRDFLTKKINQQEPVFFDVGGNKGEYTALLRTHFQKANIHTFEPNPNTFQVLCDKPTAGVTFVKKGIGAENGELELFFDAEDKTSVQATSDPEILKKIAKTKTITSEKIEVITLDSYCEANQIDQIDLLKIDTEGFELEALMGAQKLLTQKAIGMIQFEFNEVNIVKRRFLIDFYELLGDFDFYRMDEKRLIPLKEWQPIHEIFLFQNILAIQK